jgi:hypothetical protein
MPASKEREDNLPDGQRVDVMFRTPEEKARYARRVDAIGGTLRGYARVCLMRDVEAWERETGLSAPAAPRPATEGVPA